LIDGDKTIFSGLRERAAEFARLLLASVPAVSDQLF
jgi:hypothetical protein